MKFLTWQNPEQLFVAQELINKVKSKCCGIKDKYRERIKVMMVLGMVLAMIVAGCAEYGARTNMKNFA